MTIPEQNEALATDRKRNSDRATRNRGAWPVAMHVEKGELKEDRPIGVER